MNSCADPYGVLMVRPGATAQEIRTAFKTLIGQWHPDVSTSPEAHNRSAAIIEAYRVLSQPERRLRPDRRSQGGSASAAPIHRSHERRQGERRRNRSSPLPRAWRAVTLAWAAVAGMMVASAVAAELPTGRTDEITLSAPSF